MDMQRLEQKIDQILDFYNVQDNRSSIVSRIMKAINAELQDKVVGKAC